jgi:hypothetical protein
MIKSSTYIDDKPVATDLRSPFPCALHGAIGATSGVAVGVCVMTVMKNTKERDLECTIMYVMKHTAAVGAV